MLLALIAFICFAGLVMAWAVLPASPATTVRAESAPLELPEGEFAAAQS
jgi:hypothetical protein